MTRQDLMEKRLYFMILAMQMSTSLMKLLVFLFTLAIYQNYKKMIILYNHFPSLSLSTVLYIFVTSYFSLRAMQSRQRGCKKFKFKKTNFVFPQEHPGPPPWQFPSQQLLGSSRNIEALRDDPYDGCEGDYPGCVRAFSDCLRFRRT